MIKKFEEVESTYDSNGDGRNEYVVQDTLYKDIRFDAAYGGWLTSSNRGGGVMRTSGGVPGSEAMLSPKRVYTGGMHTLPETPARPDPILGSGQLGLFRHFILFGLVILAVLLTGPHLGASEVHAPSSDQPVSAIWTADGSLISGWTDGSLRILDPQGTVRRLPLGERQEISRLVLIPDDPAKPGTPSRIVVESRDNNSPTRWWVLNLADGSILGSWEGDGRGPSQYLVWLPTTSQLAWIDRDDALNLRTLAPDSSSVALPLTAYEQLKTGFFLVGPGGTSLTLNWTILSLPEAQSRRLGEYDHMVSTAEPVSGLAEVIIPNSGNIGSRNWLVRLDPRTGAIKKKLLEINRPTGTWSRSGDGRTVLYQGEPIGSQGAVWYQLQAPDWQPQPWTPPPAAYQAPDISDSPTGYTPLQLIPNYDATAVAALYRYGQGPELRTFDLASGRELGQISRASELASQRLGERANWLGYFLLGTGGLLLFGRILALARRWEKSPWAWQGSKLLCLLLGSMILAWSVYSVSLGTGAELGLAGLSWSLVMIFVGLNTLTLDSRKTLGTGLIFLVGGLVVWFGLDWLYRLLPRGDLSVTSSTLVRWSSGRPLVDEGDGFWLYPVFAARTTALVLAADALLHSLGKLIPRRP